MFVALCDDEKSMLNHLTILLQEYGSKKGVEIIIGKFENGYDLLKSFRKYEIVFMDYQLKDIDGIKTARKMREGNCDCTIIFVSAYPEAALDSFEVNTFRFLRKPVDKHKLFCALDDYMKSIDFDNLLILKTNDGTWKIKTSDIIYAEAQSKHTVIRTVNECLEVFVHLKVIENKLPSKKFIRCQRAYVAGFEHIRRHTNSEIFFDNGERAMIGKLYSKKFKQEFQKYVVRYNSRTL